MKAPFYTLFGTICKSGILKLFVLLPGILVAQTATYSWSGYTAGASSYTTGIMTATVTYTSVTMQYSSPKYYAGAAVGSGQCGLAGGLALECLYGNITNAAVNLSMDFTNGGTQNGTCASIKFIIEDINADESVQTFADWVEISGLDATNTAIAAASIVINLGSSTTQTTSGNTKIIKGYSGSYGSRSSTPCNTTTVTVTPPAGVPLKSINLKYHPDYTVCNNCYWNFPGPPQRPAYQYISIGQLNATVTAGCTVTMLPVELISFMGKCGEVNKKFEWETASEKNNDHFLLEGSNNGQSFTELGKIIAVGNSQITQHYNYTFETGEYDYRYFRLSQTDRNGAKEVLKTINLKCSGQESMFQLVPNPAHERISVITDEELNGNAEISFVNALGEIVKRQAWYGGSGKESEIDLSEIPPGVYYVVLQGAGTDGSFRPTKLVKE